MSDQLTITDPLDRFFPKVDQDPETDCWVWTGSRNPGGYGLFYVGHRLVVAHRFAYERFVGLVPPGLELDHLCRVRACVNPGHVEPVTRSENIRRGLGPELSAKRQLIKTHCPQGHPYEEANTYVNPAGARECRECNRRKQREYMARRKAA